MTRGVNGTQIEIITDYHFIMLHMPLRLKSRILKHGIFGQHADHLCARG